jgi:serine protease Do
MSLGKKILLAGFLMAGILLLQETHAVHLARAQSSEEVEIKTSPKFLAAFRDVISKAAQSTVRVQCNGKDTALGVVITPDGFILTKHSDLTEKIVVKIADREFEAKLVGIDEPHDLAMLKIKASSLTPVVWKESKVAPVGNFVCTPGPGGEPLCAGVVSVSSRTMPAAKVSAKPAANSGYLGVALEDGDKDKGAKVADVVAGTAAEKAKIMVDDIITAVDDQVIVDAEALVKTLQKFKVKDTVTLKILRGAKQLELKVTLGERPPELDRAAFQNNMGSKLSKRRDGFPTILQHDSVINPVDCGGPLVDLEGQVIGINICRAGRVESYAIPSEAIQPLLEDLKSGKRLPNQEKN